MSVSQGRYLVIQAQTRPVPGACVAGGWNRSTLEQRLKMPAQTHSHDRFFRVSLEGTANMRGDYNYKNCQSLFGYSYAVHLRSGGICQLCGAGSKEPSFDLWRQLTVEHIIGKKQGGYLKDIRKLVSELLPESGAAEKNKLSLAIDAANTVTVCSFCNSTTSRNVSELSMRELVSSAVSESQNPEIIIKQVSTATREILEKKRADVAWKLKSIRSQYEKRFLMSVSSERVLYLCFEGGAVYTSEKAGKLLVILDEGTMADILPADELEGIDLVKIIEFASESERSAYLLQRFGPARR